MGGNDPQEQVNVPTGPGQVPVQAGDGGKEASRVQPGQRGAQDDGEQQGQGGAKEDEEAGGYQRRPFEGG